MLLSNDILIPEVARLVSEGKTVTLPLRGYSMRPYLEDGRDKGLLTKVTEPLKVGDVILARIDGEAEAVSTPNGPATRHLSCRGAEPQFRIRKLV